VKIPLTEGVPLKIGTNEAILAKSLISGSKKLRTTSLINQTVRLDLVDVISQVKVAVTSAEIIFAVLK
jgi:hypothetical protein